MKNLIRRDLHVETLSPARRAMSRPATKRLFVRDLFVPHRHYYPQYLARVDNKICVAHKFSIYLHNNLYLRNICNIIQTQTVDMIS